MSLIGLNCQDCGTTLRSYEEEETELCFDCMGEGTEDSGKDWGVWCRVSGGVTGTREAWLKQDGQRFYGTQEEAEALAADENARPKSPHSFACYRYTARHTFLEVA